MSEIHEIVSDDYDVKIDILNLKTRTYNVLIKAGIKTIGDIRSRSIEDFMIIPGLGRKSVEDFVNKAKEYGITFWSKYANKE